MDVTSAQDRRDVEGYAVLRAILDEAYDQSARGKGADRHANGRAFEEQPILEIGRMVGPGFATGQVMKKAQEATSMAARGEPEAAVRELLGVIVYAASAVALLRESPDRRRGEADPSPPEGYDAYIQQIVDAQPAEFVHASIEIIDWLREPGNAEFMADDIERRRREAASARPKVGDQYEWLGLMDSRFYTVGCRYQVRKVLGETAWLTDDDQGGVHKWPLPDLKAHFRKVE